MKHDTAAVPYTDQLFKRLRSSTQAAAYLQAALEEDDRRVFLLALRDVAEARGVRKVAARARLNRESLYRMLSRKGNPELASLNALLKAMGLKLAIEAKVAG